MNRPDLCLEFVNTRFWRGQAEPTETLKAPEDLAGWTAANGGPRLGKPPARREFERAIELRETLHRLFDAEARARRLWLEHRCEVGNGAGAAGARSMVGGRPAGRPAPRSRQALRQPRMRLAVPRRQPRRQTPLVLHAELRQPRQGAAPLSPQS